MTEALNPDFSPEEFLATEGPGRRIVHLKPKGVFFTQGNEGGCVFFLLSGRAKLTVVSNTGKEATITLLLPGDFLGEESIAGKHRVRTATATAMAACSAMRLEDHEMLRILKHEHAFSAFFVKFLLNRSKRTQADLVDQLFNASEKRLARTLLLMAEYGQKDKPEMLIPEITQEALAEMIGTTRSRVSFFMNRFRRLGYIDYNGRIRVNKALLNMVLNDHLPEQNTSRPTIVESARPSRNDPKSKIVSQS